MNCSRLLPIGNEQLPEQQFCLLLNVSQCDVTETNDRYVTTIYNPRSQEETTYIRLPVTSGVFTVIDADGSELVTQLIPLSEGATLQLLKSERTNSIATHELVFQAARIPPLGHKSFYIQKMATAKTQDDLKRSFNQLTKVWRPQQLAADEQVSITNEKLTVAFDSSSGLMSHLIVDGIQVAVNQNLMWYPGMREGSTGSSSLDRPSGAYIFRPNGTEAFAISDTATLTVYRGAIVQEVHQQFSDWASQIVRIYKGQSDVEIEWTIGSIPVDDGVPKEIINRIVTQVASQSTFYTDSNGRQTLQRKLNYRPTWDLQVTEPVSGNYYPINSHIYLTDSGQDQVVALINDRSQGGTSLRDGELELMIHRRLLDDDHKGVGEALNEHEQEPDLPIRGPGLPARGTHYLVVDAQLNGRHPMSLIRPMAQQLFMKPWLSFAVTDFTYTKWKNNFAMKKSGLRKGSSALPDNIHILTLEPWGGDGTHLLRLEHVYDAGEHPTLSQPVDITLDVLRII